MGDYMNEKIILFSIGSVQEYIINSRNLKDLKNSSDIIKEIMLKGIEFFKCFEGKLILPNLEVDNLNLLKNDNNIPNYFIIKYKNSEYLGKKLEEELKEFYIEKVEKELEPDNKKISNEIIKNQIKSTFNFYWVETEYNDKNYEKLYNELYAHFDAVKNSKKYSTLEETGKKCSICGEKNVYFKDKNNNKINCFIGKKLKENETLCISCYFKRIYNNENLSTAKIALSCLEENEKFKKILNQYNNNDKDKDLYEDILDSKDNVDLPNYYCIYRLDIDNLGKWMSGKYFTSTENKTFKEYQQNLSLKINEFFNKIKEFFNNKNKLDFLIYAGGDDLLAVLPVSLIYEFDNEIFKIFKKIFKGEYSKLTYSKGIFITHYKTPLKEIVRVSKTELEKTKERFSEKRIDRELEKNSTVISIMSEGYDSRSIYFKNKLHNENAIEFVLRDLQKYFSESSSYFHFDLENQFINMNDIEENNLIDVFMLEQRRLMKRAYKNKDNGKDNEFENVHEKLLKYLELNAKLGDFIDFENYFNLFHIVRKYSQLMRKCLK
jgi:CRISPR-associated protein Cmr2